MISFVDILDQTAVAAHVATAEQPSSEKMKIGNRRAEPPLGPIESNDPEEPARSLNQPKGAPSGMYEVPSTLLDHLAFGGPWELALLAIHPHQDGASRITIRVCDHCVSRTSDDSHKLRALYYEADRRPNRNISKNHAPTLELRLRPVKQVAPP